jgi:DNA-binding MarR family transcriptional regulator
VKKKTIPITDKYVRVLSYLEIHGDKTLNQIVGEIKLSKYEVLQIIKDLSEKEIPFITTFSLSVGDEKRYYKLTTDGVDYLHKLETQHFQKEQNRIMSRQTIFIGLQVFIALLTILAGIMLGRSSNSLMEKSIFIAELQTNISRTQTEILAKSSQPFTPEINLINEAIPYYTAQAFLGDNKTKNNGMLIHPRIQNIGKSDPVELFCQTLPSSNNYYAKFLIDSEMIHESDAIQLINFSEDNTKTLKMVIRYRECGGEYPVCTSTDKIPLGWQHIKVYCQCYACTTESIVKDISFCVYNSDINICHNS